MSEWIDDAIVLSTRPYQEKGQIVTVLTRDHGKCAGFVYDNKPLRQAGAFELGSLVRVRWLGRLPDQLGRFDVEPLGYTAAGLFDSVHGLAGLRSLCAMLDAGLPERESCPETFLATEAMLPYLGEGIGPALYVKWETLLLETLGFRLELAACTVTGRNDRLAFVSPRTGRAVSLSAAEGYQDKLLKLPGFLIGEGLGDWAAVLDGLALTGHFLQRHVFDTVHQSLPESRRVFVEFCSAQAMNSASFAHHE